MLESTPQTGNRSFDTKSNRDLYQILDVDPAADRVAIRSSYLRMKNSLASGHLAYGLLSDVELADLEADIDFAFRVLNDDYQRKKYDVQSLHVDGEPVSSLANSVTSGAETAFPEMNLVQVGSPVQMCKKSVCEKSEDPTTHEQLSHLIACEEGDPPRTLFQMRELCGVTLQELHEHTKVSMHHLKAMESTEATNLPVRVYLRGFLQAYLKYFGFASDSDVSTRFVSRYLARMQSE